MPRFTIFQEASMTNKGKYIQIDALKPFPSPLNPFDRPFAAASIAFTLSHEDCHRKSICIKLQVRAVVLVPNLAFEIITCRIFNPGRSTTKSYIRKME